MLYRAKKTANKLGDVLVRPCLLMYCWGCFGLLMMPEWLFNDSGSIAIFLLMISGTSNLFIKSGPVDPVFITNLFQKIQGNRGIILGNIIFHISESVNLKMLEFSDTIGTVWFCCCLFLF